MGHPPVILPNNRVVFLGQTGSGKSRACGRMILGYQNVIALDTKGDSDGERGFHIDGYKKFWPDAWAAGLPIPRFTKLKDLAKFGAGRAIYRPDPEEMTFEWYEALFKWVYDRKNTILWIDEVYSVVEGAEDAGFYLKALMTRGRSRGIGVWSCSQRPKHVPNVIYSESEHFYVFRLNIEDDRRKVSGWAGKEVLQNPTGAHGFWYHNNSMAHPLMIPNGYPLPRV